VVLPAPPPGLVRPGADGPGRRHGPETEDLGEDRALFDALSSDPVSLDQLVRSTGLTIAALCGGLERLARAGVARDVGGWWERT
jgi:predicted Rossmann fold nucleotide-binding protein DprA/Smf involved in DNA uptake